MSDQFLWIIVLGLGVAFGGMFILSGRLERNLRETVEFMIRCNYMIVSHLERHPGRTLDMQEEPPAGMAFERRHTQRRDSRRQTNTGRPSEQRGTSPGRRSEDLRESAKV